MHHGCAQEAHPVSKRDEISQTVPFLFPEFQGNRLPGSGAFAPLRFESGKNHRPAPHRHLRQASAAPRQSHKAVPNDGSSAFRQALARQ